VGEPAECDYCENRSENAPCAEVDDVIEYTVQQICLHYEDPANEVGYESAEGGYQLPTMDSRELLHEVGLGGAHSDLFDLIVDKLDAECGIWVKKDPYASSYHEQLGYDWDSFSREVKHRNRFTFFLSSPRHDRDGDTAVEKPFEILYHIGHVVDIANAFMDLDVRSLVYRGRKHDPAVTIAAQRDLGSPPVANAKQSRMSPAGVAMFYGALDANTVVSELQPSAGGVVTIGTFKPKRRLILADFSRTGWQASIFRYESATEFEAAAFLNHFASEIAQPIVGDERVHVDYVPTQVVTEYFRFLYSMEHSQIDGIAYRSSLCKNGVNIVLFVNQDEWPEILTLETTSRRHVPAVT
jgi:hypothetical protein